MSLPIKVVQFIDSLSSSLHESAQTAHLLDQVTFQSHVIQVIHGLPLSKLKSLIQQHQQAVLTQLWNKYEKEVLQLKSATLHKKKSSLATQSKVDDQHNATDQLFLFHSRAYLKALSQLPATTTAIAPLLLPTNSHPMAHEAFIQAFIQTNKCNTTADNTKQQLSQELGAYVQGIILSLSAVTSLSHLLNVMYMSQTYILKLVTNLIQVDKHADRKEELQQVHSLIDFFDTHFHSLITSSIHTQMTSATAHETFIRQCLRQYYHSLSVLLLAEWSLLPLFRSSSKSTSSSSSSPHHASSTSYTVQNINQQMFEQQIHRCRILLRNGINHTDRFSTHNNNLVGEIILLQKIVQLMTTVNTSSTNHATLPLHNVPLFTQSTLLSHLFHSFLHDIVPKLSAGFRHEEEYVRFALLVRSMSNSNNFKTSSASSSSSSSQSQQVYTTFISLLRSFLVSFPSIPLPLPLRAWGVVNGIKFVHDMFQTEENKLTLFLNHQSAKTSTENKKTEPKKTNIITDLKLKSLLQQMLGESINEHDAADSKDILDEEVQFNSLLQDTATSSSFIQQNGAKNLKAVIQEHKSNASQEDDTPLFFIDSAGQDNQKKQSAAKSSDEKDEEKEKKKLHSNISHLITEISNTKSAPVKSSQNNDEEDSDEEAEENDENDEEEEDGDAQADVEEELRRAHEELDDDGSALAGEKEAAVFAAQPDTGDNWIIESNDNEEEKQVETKAAKKGKAAASAASTRKRKAAEVPEAQEESASKGRASRSKRK